MSIFADHGAMDQRIMNFWLASGQYWLGKDGIFCRLNYGGQFKMLQAFVGNALLVFFSIGNVCFCLYL